MAPLASSSSAKNKTAGTRAAMMGLYLLLAALALGLLAAIIGFVQRLIQNARNGELRRNRRHHQRWWLGGGLGGLGGLGVLRRGLTANEMEDENGAGHHYDSRNATAPAPRSRKEERAAKAAAEEAQRFDPFQRVPLRAMNPDPQPAAPKAALLQLFGRGRAQEGEKKGRHHQKHSRGRNKGRN